ncbi:hypothetical protein BXY66_0893 [Shimia isoporae]|uniref:DUF6455 domain-containing protein n=1 Tax=Shimia isoporae TaxID=647720 RepID=A0A4R1NUX2_9RHOB|nr:DUF6455 family protein [Shimia isoporae]TCL08852.1 hypothetical protein BXY66_0893 [Shimia isoporae]
MPKAQNLRRHVALMDNAARRVGMDLQEAAIRGALRVDEISDAVVRCTNCPKPDACEAWLMKGPGTKGDLPEFCRNKVMFSRVGAVLT